MPRLALFALLCALPASPACADIYVIDKDHTEVRFSWNHLGLSRQSARFLDVSGTVAFEPAEPEAAYADVTIKMDSIHSGVTALDRALKSGDFFDIARFPTATFKSTEVRRTGRKTAQMIGGLTINGVIRPVTLDVIWNFTGDHPMAAINPAYHGLYVSGFSATTQLRRSDWGVTRTIPYVSDEIQITIETELRRKEQTHAPVSGDPGSNPAQTSPRNTHEAPFDANGFAAQ